MAIILDSSSDRLIFKHDPRDYLAMLQDGVFILVRYVKLEVMQWQLSQQMFGPQPEKEARLKDEAGAVRFIEEMVNHHIKIISPMLERGGQDVFLDALLKALKDGDGKAIVLGFIGRLRSRLQQRIEMLNELEEYFKAEEKPSEEKPNDQG